MLRLLKPAIGLPANLLHKAFQMDTVLVNPSKNLIERREILGIAADAGRHTFPYTISGTEILGADNTAKLGYFLNEKGGMVIHCEYNAPSFFDRERRETLVLIGKHTGQGILKTAFAFLGYPEEQMLMPRCIKIFREHDAHNASGFQHETTDTTSDISLMQAFSYADDCFKHVLGNTAIRPDDTRKKMMLQSADELKAKFKHLQGRYFWTLNAEVEVTKSQPISSIMEIKI